MKLTAFILLLTGLQVSASVSSQTVTFSGRKVPLTTIFGEIEKQTGILVVFNYELLQSTHPVDIQAKNMPLDKLLNFVLKGQSLEFTRSRKTIAITRAQIATNAQQWDNGEIFLPITGIIKSADGNFLAGATVRIKGKSVSTVTDEKGVFSLTASEGDVLIISYIGFGVREVKVTGNAPINISLERGETRMDTAEVVVNTGYQTISKERSAGSFAKPNMDILHDRSTSMNVLERLDGLVPGLVLGGLGSNQMLVRGLSTIGVSDGSGSYSGTNRNPLYVVDGIALDDVSSINPQDVADITVLKDATAASIWGARASNGVIVIATKKGGMSQRLKIGYNSFINFQGKPDLDYLHVMSSRDYITTVTEMFNAQATPIPWETISTRTDGAVAPHDQILYDQYRGLISAAQANKSFDSLASINNVQQIKDIFYQNAAVMNHTISVSGGWRAYSMYGSLAYTNTKLRRPGEKNNSYKVNLRQDFNLSNHIQLYLITDLTNTTTSAKRYMDVNNMFIPYQLFKDKDGNNLPVNYAADLSDSLRMDYQDRSRINLAYVPLDEVNYGYTKSDALLNRITAGATIKLFKGLRFEGVYGYVKGSNKTTSYDDAKSYPMRKEVVQFTEAPDPTSTPVYHLPATGGKLELTNISQRNWTIRNQLVYDNAWNNRLHQLTLLAGHEAQEQLTNSNNSTVRGYNEALQTYASIDYVTLGTVGVTDPVWSNVFGQNTLSNDAFSNSEVQSRFTSYYVNTAYTFNRKYSINGSWRIDKSNLFGLDKSAQNKPAWSVGGKWMLSDENFMRSNTWLDRLAVRATYGITGNSPAPGTSASFDILAAATSSFLPNRSGLNLATAGNKRLTWETTKTINLGLDIGVLHDRIAASIDVYQKKTDNLLGKMPVNGFTGYAMIIGNFGSLTNKGVELSLSSLNISGKNFSWNSQLTFSYNKNKVTQLNDPTALITGSQKVDASFATGFPAFAIFAYPFAGLDGLGDPMIRLADKTVTKEMNVAMPDDIRFMGTAQPVWNGGLSNMFRYKGFGLTTNMIYNLGHVMQRSMEPIPYSAGILQSSVSYSGALNTGQINADFLHRWKKPGDEAFTNIPSFEPNSAVGDTRRSLSYFAAGDINVVSASFIKFRDITLTYSLPKILLDRIKTDNITLRVQLSNIMLWKANRYGIDPEFGGSYPFAQKSLTLGANVIF